MRGAWQGHRRTQLRILAIPLHEAIPHIPVGTSLGGGFCPSPAIGRRPRHPSERRSNVERVHFLRNRIAHHEPIHRRDLQKDFDAIIEVADWICGDTCDWIRPTSRVPAVLRLRP